MAMRHCFDFELRKHRFSQAHAVGHANLFTLLGQVFNIYQISYFVIILYFTCSNLITISSDNK